MKSQIVFLFGAWLAICIRALDLFRDLPYEELHSKVEQLCLNTDVCTNQSGTSLGVPSSSYRNMKCSPDIIRIFHSNMDTDKPQILISGAIHGDERVGPLVSLTLAELLVAAAKCGKYSDLGACNALQRDYNLDAADVEWLTFLGLSRDIFVLPAANCMGYALGQRDDWGVDPNRDFPYLRSNNRCLRSSTAQVMARLLTQQRIQLLLTFHGGMEAIGYEWGSPNHRHPQDHCPDHNAHRDIGKVLSEAAGSSPFSPQYKVGTMNAQVYPVEGGMEDFAYAGGWDVANLRNCVSTLPPTGSSSNPRAAVFLVETSNRKKPNANSLGGPSRIFDVSSRQNGHIPRNVRLALASIDILRPYVCISKLEVEDSGPSLTLQWYVGGSISVQSTWLQLRQISVSSNQQLRGDNFVEQKYGFKSFNLSVSQRGRGIWFSANNSVNIRAAALTEKSFSWVIQIAHLLAVIREEDQNLKHVWEIVACATVDSRWAIAGQGYPVRQNPVTDIARARGSVYASLPIKLMVEQDKLVFSTHLRCADWKESSSATINFIATNKSHTLSFRQQETGNELVISLFRTRIIFVVLILVCAAIVTTCIKWNFAKPRRMLQQRRP